MYLLSSFNPETGINASWIVPVCIAGGVLVVLGIIGAILKRGK